MFVRFPTKPCLPVTVFRSELGMTLVEVLASLSLLMILLAVISQFLYTDVRLWGKNDQIYERSYQTRVLAKTFRLDLSSLVNSPFLAEPAVQGDDYQFVFWAENQDGLVQIQYRFDTSEKKVYRSVGFWGSKPQEKLFFAQVEEWKIEYFRPKTKNWELQWQPVQKTDIPSLIRVTFQAQKNKATTLVIPIPAWHSESDNGT